MQAPPLPQPGQQPTPQQIQMMQQQFYAEAAKQGLTPQQFAEKLRQMQQQQRAQVSQSPSASGQSPSGQQPEPGQPQQVQTQQQVPIQPGPPKPEALAVAKFLRNQNLKSRPCIFQEKRRELFKVKRAIRALQSVAYTKARTKNPVLPEVTDRASAENTFKLLPISMLALRVSKLDPTANPSHGQPGHSHGSSKKAKSGGKTLWTVKVEQQQDARDELYYIWLYDGPQWRQKVYAGLALLAVVAVVLFPLWPLFLRKGVWYLSMASLGVLAGFFGLAVVRLLTFLVTVVAGPKPGIWLFPNLFEDVGFFDSFKPGWDWRETKSSLAEKKAAKKAKKAQKHKGTTKGADVITEGKGMVTNGTATTVNGSVGTAIMGSLPNSSASSHTSGAQPAAASGVSRNTSKAARVEEVADD